MLESQLALSSGVLDRLPDPERFRAALMSRAADVRGVLMRREPEARRVLQAVFAERLQFAPPAACATAAPPLSVPFTLTPRDPDGLLDGLTPAQRG